MAYADLSDVRIHDRELGPDDEVFDWVDTLLNYAELMLREEFPDLDTRITDGRTKLELVVLAEAEMVAAVTRNPEALQSSSDTVGGLSGSRTFNLEAASGLLKVTDRQRALVRGGPAAGASPGGAFTIRPTGHTGSRLRRPLWRAG